jgi:hypothetical protein
VWLSCHVLSLPSFLVFIAGSALCFSHETSSGKFANHKQLNTQHVRGRLWPTFLSGANDKSASDHEIHYLSSHTGTIWYNGFTISKRIKTCNYRTYEFNKREPTKGMRTMRILAEAFRRKQQGHKSPGSSMRSYPEWAGSTQWAIGIFKIGPCFVNLSQPNAIGHHGSQSKWYSREFLLVQTWTCTAIPGRRKDKGR